ncbi:hypothetical protein ACH5RR_017177 [Cinchona calisaya]|uniref:Late embryogenesis abundant protein LEA-2 subgroup domain-containing protein n=1 Tax=Cinchona calisaya TaxID=153742 RepID=A0ABD3A3Q6_9GENT
MAGKEPQSPHPLVPGRANGTYVRPDEEAAREDSKELRRQKRKKYLLYFIAFVIFQTAIIVLFTLTIMKVRTPKFRLKSGTLDNFVGNQTDPSFDFSMNAQFSVKNANFGKYKYQNTPVEFYYRGSPVGVAKIPKSSVGWRSTKKFNFVVNLNSANITTSEKSQLPMDLNNGILRLTSQAELTGKVELTFIFKKKKNTKMNCSMDVAIATKQLTNISCK